jgi:hypothetical protein
MAAYLSQSIDDFGELVANILADAGVLILFGIYSDNSESEY